MKKTGLLVFIFITAASLLNAREYSENEKKFVKGNINDKTQAVRSASGLEAFELTKKSINFALENKAIIGNDRELNALAVTGVLSVTQGMLDSISSEEKNRLFSNIFALYENFEDTNVKVAVLTKISQLNFPNEKFVILLNDYIKRADPETEKHDLMSSSIKTLGAIGNSDSFKTLFTYINNPKWKSYYSDIEEAIGMLSSTSENELLELIRTGNTDYCRYILSFVTKSSKNSQLFKAEIAENTLLRAIYIYENTGSLTDELISLQYDSFELLKNLKWTRASGTVIGYFDIAEKEYSSGKLSENNYVNVIAGLKETSPIEAVPKLSAYLNKLNKNMENHSEAVSEPVVLEVINTLGAIGDKNAFDSLLAVTYYAYSDKVIAQARVALAKLKW